MQKREHFSLSRKDVAITYCVMKLSEYLQEKLQKRGTQARFARNAKISDATASKWARGEMDRAPNFENCLRIARYFKMSPLDIFEMAERPDYRDLFIELFPDYVPEAFQEPEPSIAIEAHHKKLHEYFEHILCSGMPLAEWLAGNIAIFYAQLTGTKLDTDAVAGVKIAEESAGGPAEGEHGPFDTAAMPIPGVSRVEFAEPVPQRRRK